jgi:hypothetical protein
MEEHALLVEGREQVSVDEAAWPAEHVLLLDTRVLWGKLGEKVHQGGGRFFPVHLFSFGGYKRPQHRQECLCYNVGTKADVAGLKARSTVNLRTSGS